MLIVPEELLSLQQSDILLKLQFNIHFGQRSMLLYFWLSIYKQRNLVHFQLHDLPLYEIQRWHKYMSELFIKLLSLQ